MLRNSIIFIISLLILTMSINAEENNYPLIFKDDLTSSFIKSITYNDSNNYLYVNGVELYPTQSENNNYYSLMINDINFNFVYSNENKNIIIKYQKPIELRIATEISVKTINNKTYLRVSDINGSMDYLGNETSEGISFNSVVLNINNYVIYTNAYLDKSNNNLIFSNRNYNFNAILKEIKSVDLLLNGKVENNKIYAIQNPMNLLDSLNGELNDETINRYLADITVNLFNDTYAITRKITLSKLMDKWNKVSSNNYEKEAVITACVNKESMCEVFDKTAYLINDYNYKIAKEDSDNLVDGTSETPVNKRIYTTDDQYSYTEVLGDNLEIYKQERNKTLKYNNWSEYKEEECEDTDEKKCRYKDFYTKYTYPYVKSEPQYSKWLKANYLLDDPVEETDTQKTLGPYLNCTKYEEKEIEVNTYTCNARDETVHKSLVQCEGDVYFEKFCMADRFVNPKKEYALEPLEENNRDFCAKCLVKKSQIVVKDSEGNEYANFNVNGKSTKIYLPKGNCIDYTKETHTEVIRGLCEVMEYKYDLYYRDYLGDIDYYEETPIIENNLELCEEKTSKEDGKIECSKIVKSSFSTPDIKYSEWKDVDNFSYLENTERRYRYKSFKTNGIKIENKIIEKGEYNKEQADNIINLLATEKTKQNFADTTDQFALVEKYKVTDAFEINKQNNIYLLENEKIFAPVIHVLENDVSQLETIQFPQYEGSKVLGTSSIYDVEEIEEVLFLPVVEKTDKKVVFFNPNNTAKIDDADNWKDKKELLETIKDLDINNPKYEITINREQLKELNNWIKNKDNRNKNNCEFIREFANIITKPTNFKDQLLKSSGCEF